MSRQHNTEGKFTYHAFSYRSKHDQQKEVPCEVGKGCKSYRDAVEESSYMLGGFVTIKKCWSNYYGA